MDRANGAGPDGAQEVTEAQQPTRFSHANAFYAGKSDFIQIMRFVAATMVVYSHHTLYVRERIDRSYDVSLLGPAGVALFFMISGLVMVISSRKLTRDWAGAREFMVRRLLRIVPLYWVATALKIGVAILLPQMVIHNTFDPIYALKSLLFIPVFSPAGTVTPILGVGWSLVHEMYFYLLYAAAMIIGGRVALWSAMAVVSVILYGQYHTVDSAPSLMATNTVNGYFVIGILMAMAMTNQKKPQLWSIVLAASLAGVGFLTIFNDRTLLPFIVQPWAFLPGAAIMVFHKVIIRGVAKWLVRLGDSSYALYLFHTFYGTPLILAFHHLAPDVALQVKVVISTVVSIAIGHLCHLWIERPLNRHVASLFGRNPG